MKTGRPRIHPQRVIVQCPFCEKTREIDYWNTTKLNYTGLCKTCNPLTLYLRRTTPRREGRSYDGDGYIRVRIYPENRFWKMAAKSGYIYEHRLVIAQKLNRLLDRREVVHHLNGTRDDNRPENLVVIPIGGKHSAHTLSKFLQQRIRELEQKIKELSSWENLKEVE